ncbi:MAG TPA: DUF4440 domain-containing protein [Xanthomonadales bacterium]|nr:DUF4440 domain-containing protein [Xanthomonadales bacterium]
MRLNRPCFALLLAASLSAPCLADEATDGAAVRQLFVDYNAAIERGDRDAATALFLPDYAWVHSTGTVDSRERLVDRALANSPRTGARVPDASELSLHGDTALLRTPDRDGAYATTVLVRDAGRWRFAHAQGTRLPPKREAIAIGAADLDQFVGSYEFGPGRVATVVRDGDSLTWKGGARPPVTLVAFAPGRFYGRESEAEMTFAADASGVVTGVTLRLGSCQDSQAHRVR